MASEISPVKLRHNHSSSMDQTEPQETFPMESPIRSRLRPRSASYAALRSAVFQLTCLSDFTKEKIGSGFFADVFKVKHRVTGEVMVLKMNKSKKTSKQMLSEIQLMNRLSHPNILKFKGSCVHEGQLHALTEFINGGSLEDHLHDREVEISWSVRVKIARDIARGMAYLHSRNVFHRDLNSRNCLIKNHPNGSLTTVVADFGLAAKIKQRKRRSYTETVGSPYWMAPECLNGKEYCELADVFSFGITLAEILTRMPADPDFIPRTSHYGLNGEALRKLCEGCPEELFQLMCSCCQMDPDDRPSFDDAVAVLEALANDSSDITQSDTNNQCIDDTASLDDDHYLRSCFSEPYLRLSDNVPAGSAGSGFSGYRLDSIGSSTASTGSSCGSLIEEPETMNGGGCIALSRAVASSKLEYTPHGNSTTELSGCPQQHGELKKTNSLTLPGSDSGSDLEHSSTLNCSVQTLIGDEDNTCSKDFASGGDSGIDPGELEVFKFPPPTPADLEEKQSTQELHTLDSYTGKPPPTGALSPPRTSTEQIEGAHFTTPPSPFTQSWASSEFSFQLPQPSTPYAPPCTPVPPPRRCCSCPSSPTPSSRFSRFSLDCARLKTSLFESETPFPDKSDRKKTFYRDSLSFEQSSIDRDLEDAKNKSNRRSVHFDDEVCTNLHQEHFSKMGSRTRSKSTPTQPIIKQSSVYSLSLPRYKNSQTVLCKGFNVTLRRNARLSNSLPSLFKC